MIPSQARPLPQLGNALLAQVLGLLAFSTLCTAGGAAITPLLGAQALIIGMGGSLVTLLILIFVRGLPVPVRLGMFYLYSTFEGLALGFVISRYLAAGLGNIVVLAAGTTGVLVLALSAYAWRTTRDLRGL